ncbi:FH1/FH2 domain-containing protein 1 isoform X4 [Sitodiplosis mosellana]|uniref:FH1/FH2 domain-containing protein 1 isoform X4 n=1 Tax=Sitodiplosis mosellana TaxID=263140 RepID=UPI0024445E79|nr:FH1/FH2 domain-containing protein 1 isoform X4 [Sitodiplosis mosellana]
MILKMEPDELFTIKVQYLADTDPFNCLSMYPIPSRAPTYSFTYSSPLATQLGSVLRLLGAPQRLDDAALQVRFQDGDYGAYLDLESSLAEQSEELEGLHSNNRKNSLVVRTQLSVRVHAIIEKLLTSEGRELRRALFSLKQIFQDDKDLVHGFVALGGLNSLVRVGNNADQNYQNYILRALGQVMLYVDGMNGVMHHSPTIQWLYSLIASKYRLVVKTALKLLLVFVEYVESNCYLLVNAIHVVDAAQDSLPWSNIMQLLKDYENADTELLIYATTLINKTLSGLSDQDSFYDESDFLEQQGMESVIQRYMSRPGTDLDLLDQLQLYDAVLRFEDGETDGIRIPDNSVRKTPRCRSLNANGGDPLERRKSRRHSSDAAPNPAKFYSPRSPITMHQTLDEDSSSSVNSGELNDVFGVPKGTHESAGVTPGLRRRRERAERQKSFLREQQEAAAAGLRPFDIKDDIINNHGVLVTALYTALPCRLQNDSPPNSIEQTHLNKKNDSPIIPNIITDSQPRINENNNLIKAPKIPPDLETVIDESNYVNLNDITAKCKAIDFTRNAQKPTDILTNGMEKSSQNHMNVIDNKNNSLLNNFYLQINSTSTITNGYNTCKPIISIVNQKNLNNLNNSNNSINLAKNSLNSVSNSNSSNLSIGNTNKLNSSNGNGNGNGNNNNTNSNCNGVLNDASVDAKSITTNVADYNKNGLPSVSTLTHLQNDLTNGHQMQCTNKSGISNSVTYVIQNGNGLLSNGNNGIKELPRIDSSNKDSENDEKRLLMQIKRDHTVKDLTQKLSNLPINSQEEKTQNRIGDMSGLISKAKEGLAKSKSKGDISRSPSKDQEIRKPEPKKSENELHWEELMKNMTRPLNLCDLDFTDLHSDDDKDDLMPRGFGGAMIPPPPPPIGIPPPMKAMQPPLEPLSNVRHMNGSKATAIPNTTSIKKNKKTVKLFWKEIREDLIPVHIGKTIWDEIPTAVIDTQKLEHLFESRAKDTISKKQQEMNKNKEIIVLDHKRSNAINIAMTKLPPPRAIKAAILKMDATVVTREGIDKLLNMLPTEEERGKIQEAQMVNPELPLGSAEQFLLTLSSISELSARLKLWAFKLDFEISEKEIAEPLMDLKQGLDVLRNNKTFKCILSTLLSIGIFLNGAPAKGFQIEYLAKVPEVKDTVHKHSLLHHLCNIVMESSSDTTDLYSEIGPVTRASKADFADLAHNITYLESECKASWDRLKLIAKHDCPPQLKQKMVDFLADCAERIIILQIVHRRVINRYRKFLLWLGVPQHRVMESRPNEVCRIISEFALEYRTTRERVHQQLEKKANHRERNKTRGKMIIDVAKFRSNEDRADAELKQLLGSQSPSVDNLDSPCQFTGFRRKRPEVLRSPAMKMSEDTFTDGDDELLESLVKTATSTQRTAPRRERKRSTRNADRKSFKRSRTREGFTVERSTASP